MFINTIYPLVTAEEAVWQSFSPCYLMEVESFLTYTTMHKPTQLTTMRKKKSLGENDLLPRAAQNKKPPKELKCHSAD